MKHPLPRIICLAAIAGFGWLLPPFHVVSLPKSPQQEPAGASAVAASFWEKAMLPAAGKAVPVPDLLAALTKDPNAARQQFGHLPGLGSTTCFLVRGSGRVTAVEKDGVRISLDGAAGSVEVQLATDLIFGNTVRDASGLINASSYPNSQDF